MASDVVNHEGGGAAAAAAAAMAMQQQQQQQVRAQWMPDERDGFISWLRGEFAAANAMIDALCQHLQVTGAPGEYDLVVACIQQRRFNWSPVLHMQQYFSVAEVLMALQQVNLKKHQLLAKSAKPSKENQLNPLNRETYLESKVSSLSIAEEASNSFRAANSRKHLVGYEEVEGEQVNVLEGLELHDNVFHAGAAAEMIELVTESKRVAAPKVSPAIQFGTIPVDILSAEGENSKEEIVEEKLPPCLESVVDRLVNLEVISGDKRPDSCTVTLLKPGESIQLQSYFNFEQPLYMLSLGSESSLTFGRNVKMRSTGDGEGLFFLTLPLGSVLVLQGNSLELVQLAVSPSHSLRAIVTLGKLKTVAPAAAGAAAGRGARKASPDSRHHRDGHGHGHGLRDQQSISPPPAITSPARSPVPFSPGWSTSPARGVPTTLGTGVFLPANGSATIYTPQQHQQQQQMQMNGVHQRRQVPPQFVPPN